MKLVFVNIMQELRKFDSTAYITQPPVPLAVLNGVTPKSIETELLDEQSDQINFKGDVFAFSVTTQNARVVYDYADALRAVGKKVIMGGIHVTVCPDEAICHADAIVTGEAETVWPKVCDDLLSGRLEEMYIGSPTKPSFMSPIDYRFFGNRRYLTPASLFATRGCNRKCAFCVSSRYMGPYRMKPLDILEQEIDQLMELYPRSFLQFTDDNLLANRKYASEFLTLIRRKKRNFITMITVDQYCDKALMEEMAASGCLGVAVGIESIDDDNCASVNKYQNLKQPLSDTVFNANKYGIQSCALIMVGLPHDTPERLTRTLHFLKQIPFSLYDIRVLRIYPSTSFYKQMLSTGDVTENWWLEKESTSNCNHLLPSCLSMDFKHTSFHPMQLQHMALKFTAELNMIKRNSISHVLGIGHRGHGLKLAGTILYARYRYVSQARRLLKQVEKSISTNLNIQFQNTLSLS
jgi:radical SAM superfamily enzyme YgiQ (UPF0313 family)